MVAQTGWWRNSEIKLMPKKGDSIGNFQISNVNYLTGSLAPAEEWDCWKCTLKPVGQKAKKGTGRVRRKAKKQILTELRKQLQKTSKSIAQRQKRPRGTMTDSQKKDSQKKEVNAETKAEAANAETEATSKGEAEAETTPKGEAEASGETGKAEAAPKGETAKAASANDGECFLNKKLILELAEAGNITKLQQLALACKNHVGKHHNPGLGTCPLHVCIV